MSLEQKMSLVFLISSVLLSLGINMHIQALSRGRVASFDNARRAGTATLVVIKIYRVMKFDVKCLVQKSLIMGILVMLGIQVNHKCLN